MNIFPDISYSAKLISDSSRASILQALMDVDGLPATELARKAGITLQTASSHLTKLVEGNLITVERHGRHKYYRLASSKVAETIEALSVLAPPPKVNSLNRFNHNHKLKKARSCYDHLAGLLGVYITEAFMNKGYLTEGENEKEFNVTESGVDFFLEWGIDIHRLHNLKRLFAKKCLDWSERRYHLAGALGNAIMNYMLENKWIEKRPNRQIHITPLGEENLKKELGIMLN